MSDAADKLTPCASDWLTTSNNNHQLLAVLLNESCFESDNNAYSHAIEAY